MGQRSIVRGRRGVVAGAAALLLAVGGTLAITTTATNAATPPPRVQGSVDSHVPSTASPSEVTITGWTLDARYPWSRTRVVVYDNGRKIAEDWTSIVRADVNAAKQASGTHGFRVTVKLAANTAHRVCVRGRMVGNYGTDVALNRGCFDVAVTAPVAGRFDSVRPDSEIGGFYTVNGWTYDRRESSRSAGYDVTIDGASAGRHTTDLGRSDVNAAFSITGAHDFSFPVALTPEREHEVCVFGVATASPQRYLLGCRNVAARASDQVLGKLESMRRDADGSYVATGWVLDGAYPEQDAVYVVADLNSTDTEPLAADVTSVVRADVNRVFNVSGAHGFTARFPLDPGVEHVVCVFGASSVSEKIELLRNGCVSVAGATQAPAHRMAKSKVPASNAAVVGRAVEKVLRSA